MGSFRHRHCLALLAHTFLPLCSLLLFLSLCRYRIFGMHHCRARFCHLCFTSSVGISHLGCLLHPSISSCMFCIVAFFFVPFFLATPALLINTFGSQAVIERKTAFTSIPPPHRSCSRCEKSSPPTPLSPPTRLVAEAALRASAANAGHKHDQFLFSLWVGKGQCHLVWFRSGIFFRCDEPTKEECCFVGQSSHGHVVLACMTGVLEENHFFFLTRPCVKCAAPRLRGVCLQFNLKIFARLFHRAMGSESGHCSCDEGHHFFQELWLGPKSQGLCLGPLICSRWLMVETHSQTESSPVRERPLRRIATATEQHHSR